MSAESSKGQGQSQVNQEHDNMDFHSMLNSKLAQMLGVSVVFTVAWYLTWTQMNKHIDGRFSAQDARISDLSAQAEFMRDFIKEEQGYRKALFASIEEHLGNIAKKGGGHD